MNELMPVLGEVLYPDSDGLPMSDNTLQFDWIAIIKWNLEAMFRDQPDVFIAGDHLIYAAEGQPKIRQAPDVYVAFGRPKAYRGSYQVWREESIFPQVVFEVWSPNNLAETMQSKFEFYQLYGAEEYYIIYPEFPSYIDGWIREGDVFVKVPKMHGFVSPRLGIRFDMQKGDIAIFGPNGREFTTPDEIARERDEAEEAAEQAKQRADKLRQKLRELGVDPDSL